MNRVVQFNEQTMIGLGKFNLERLLVEFDERGRIIRELGFGNDGRVAHRNPGEPTVDDYGLMGPNVIAIVGENPAPHAILMDQPTSFCRRPSNDCGYRSSVRFPPIADVSVQSQSGHMDGGPDWATAQREENRQFGNIWKGMFVGTGLSAVMFAVVLSLEREVYMHFGGYVFSVGSLGSLYIAKRRGTGSLPRSAAITIGALSAFAAAVFLFGGAGDF